MGQSVGAGPVRSASQAALRAGLALPRSVAGRRARSRRTPHDTPAACPLRRFMPGRAVATAMAVPRPLPDCSYGGAAFARVSHARDIAAGPRRSPPMHTSPGADTARWTATMAIILVIGDD